MNADKARTSYGHDGFCVRTDSRNDIGSGNDIGGGGAGRSLFERKRFIILNSASGTS